MATLGAKQWEQDDGAGCRQAKPGSPLLSLKASLTVTKVSAAPFVSAVIVCAAGNAELSPCEGRSQRVDRD